jgi:hypothetical protein
MKYGNKFNFILNPYTILETIGAQDTYPLWNLTADSLKGTDEY